ncbi:MAG: hypothetical protein QW156_04325 [Candidatus Aenigmatarchaeota archaeon]
MLIFIFNNLFSAPQESERKEKLRWTIGFIGGFSRDLYATHNQDVGFWGFVDPNINREYFGGYFFGMSLGIRPFKNIELFYGYNNIKIRSPYGEKG